MPWLSYVISNVASNVVLASLLALLAWLVQRWLGRPAIARVLWVLVLVKLVTPPLVSLPLGGSAEATACALGVCGCEQHAHRHVVVREAFWILLAAWLTGAGATGWTAWRRRARFRRLTANASPAPSEWQSLAVRLSAELSLRRTPEILAVPGRLSPLVAGGWHRPRMLLPMALMGRLDEAQRAALLLHELIHIQRGDHWARMLELTVGVIYWWLPGVGSIGRQLRACEEACCDAAVVTHRPGLRRDYARLLLDVVDFANPLPREAVPQATAMSAANVQDLEQRLRAILGLTQPARRRWPAGALAVGVACAIVPCELRYDLVGRVALGLTAASPEPGGQATNVKHFAKVRLDEVTCSHPDRVTPAPARSSSGSGTRGRPGGDRQGKQTPNFGCPS